jgi:hypothetical protein
MIKLTNLLQEISVVPSAVENAKLFVIISPMDGRIIEYSFDISPANQEKLKQKHSLPEETSFWYGVRITRQ